jgi:hypothetical protein
MKNLLLTFALLGALALLSVSVGRSGAWISSVAEEAPPVVAGGLIGVELEIAEDSDLSFWPESLHDGGAGAGQERTRIFSYTVTNASGSDVIARVAQAGLKLADPEDPDSIESVGFSLHRISDRHFRNMIAPDGALRPYLDFPSLRSAGFEPFDLSRPGFYEAGLITFGERLGADSLAALGYSPGAAVFAAPDIGVAVEASIGLGGCMLAPGGCAAGSSAYSAARGSAQADRASCVYLYLPGRSTASFKYEFRHLNDMGAAAEMGNKYQCAVLSLDATGDGSAAPELGVFAVEPLQASFRQAFGAGLDEATVDKVFGMGWGAAMPASP